MKQIVLLLFLVFSCFSEEIISGKICAISGGTVLLNDGIVEYSSNDSGSAITTSTALLWIAGNDENVQVITPAGIISLNGTAYIEVTKENVSLSVYKGYLRVLSLGGIPGETVGAGYARIIDASGEMKPREIIASDPFDSLCSLYTDTALGCLSPLTILPVDTTTDELSENETTTIVVINPLTYATGLKPELDTLSIRNLISDFFISDEHIETVLPEKENQYSKSFELSRQSNPFFIIDIHVERLPQDSKSLSITMRIFSGMKNNIQTTEFITDIKTIKTESSDTFLYHYKSTLYNNIKQWLLSII